MDLTKCYNFIRSRHFLKICYKIESSIRIQALEVFKMIYEACNRRRYTITEHFIESMKYMMIIFNVLTMNILDRAILRTYTNPTSNIHKQILRRSKNYDFTMSNLLPTLPMYTNFSHS